MTTEQLLINCYRLLVLDDKSVKRSFVLHELRREVEERIGKDATEELANEV